MTLIAPRSHQTHCVLDDHPSKQEEWNQDETNESKVMMICRVRRKQQKQQANRRHQDSRSEPSLPLILAHDIHRISSHETHANYSTLPEETG